MKRKKPNITTASLRSASSSKRSRRVTSTKNHLQITNTSNSYYSFALGGRTNNANKSIEKTPVGSASKKAYFCHGCNKEFRLYSSVQMFINKHVNGNKKCLKVYPKCICGKIFYDKKKLKAHQSRKSKDSDCFKEFSCERTDTKFNSTEVAIQPIRKQTTLATEIPTNLDPLISIQKDIMISKKHSASQSNYHSTIKFQNINIHNCKNSIPTNFSGHVTMNPKSLELKKSVIFDGIYSRSTLFKDKNSYNSTKTDQVQQIVDFGDFHSDFNTNKHDTESDLSNSSLSGNNHIDDNSNDDNSSFEVSHNKKNTGYDEIIQGIVDNESEEEIDIVDECIVIENINDNDSNYSNDIPDTVCPIQQSIIFLNRNHFQKMKMLQESELSNNICDKDYKDCLELVTILMKHNIPVNNIYKETMEWKNKEKKLTSSRKTIQSLLKSAELRVYGQSIATKMSPSQSNLICPSGRTVNVTSFDVDALIYDMLSDKDLMQTTNLVFEDGNISNPFYTKKSEIYSDFHTSEFYLETMKQKEINQETDLLVPIQLYMDETTLDDYGKLSLHPLVMTLLIFNRQTRNLSMSWRTLAYIPNFDAGFGNKNYTVDMKHNDFHFCLRYLLNGVQKLLSFTDGFDWSFEFDSYPNKSYKRNMKFVLGNVLGDAKGANVLCSRFGNNTTSHIARDCDVLTEVCDNPKHKCIFHKQKDLEKLNTEQLRELSFRRAKPSNAFSNLDFGANCYGINGACAADPCHMFNKGVVERLPKIFMARLTPKLVLALDKHVGALVTNYGNQSDRDFPNIKVFSKGVSTSAKLRSDQHIARVFVIYLVLLTTDYESIVIHKMGRRDSKDVESTRISLEEYNQWILIFEETLILHSWVYHENHPKYAFKGGKNSIVCDRLRKYMETYRKYALRKEGMGLKFLKFHQILHLWWIIRLFGSLYNVDTARCESHHKKKKAIGRQTQRRSELFDEQTALGEYKYNLFIKAIRQAGIKLPGIFEVSSSAQNIDEDVSNSNANGSKFLLTFDYKNNTIAAKWLSDKLRNKTPEFPTHILDGLFIKFNGYNHGKIGQRIRSIVGFTETRINSNIIRACPTYRGEKNWFDWVVVRWEIYGLLEAQCLLFIDFSTIQTETYDISTSVVDGINKIHTPLSLGKAALVHSITQETSRTYHRSALKKSYPKNNTKTRVDEQVYIVKNRLAKFCNMEESYQIIEIDNIHCQSFVFPYEYWNKDEVYLEGFAKSVMVISPTTSWHKYFINYYDNDLKKKAEEREDKSLSENDERFPFEG